MATIIDLTRMLAGPFATMVLGDLDHRIIKVEEKRIGDATRHHPPYRNGVSAYFFSANRNKESVILDLKHPEGRAVLLDLVKHADAVIENFRPDVMEGLGLRYEDLKAVNPGIILVSITGFGSYGPLRDHVSFDLVAQAMSGSMMSTSRDPGEPIKPAIALGDVGSGLFGCLALLQALLRRKITGEGSHLEVSLLDVMYTLSSRTGEQFLLTDAESDAPSELFPDSVYPTRDGYIAVSAYTDESWRRLAEALGRPEWMSDPRYRDAASRWAHRAEPEAALRAALGTASTESWLGLFAAAGVPAAQMRRVPELIDDPDLIARGAVISIDHAVAGSLQTFGSPIVREAPRARIRPAPPPRHGEHTLAVLARDLGYSEEKIARLCESGAVAGLLPEPA